MKKLKLRTTDDEFNDLSSAAFPQREKGEFVKVKRAALANLIMDHSAILKKIEGEYE
jgi:hypothetical protein